MTRYLSIAFVLMLFASSADAVAQDITVTLPDASKTALTPTTLKTLKRLDVQATAHGHTHKYAGFDIRDVLKTAGLKETNALHGELLARLVTFVAADGYRVVVALSEIDATIGDRQIILADQEDGAALPADDGPWRLVVPSDKRPARWIRHLTQIIVADAP
jgi:hypothetical protein